ncbi:hypothetical protein TKK_0007329 [Trichogramma kaykai]
MNDNEKGFDECVGVVRAIMGLIGLWPMKEWKGFQKFQTIGVLLILFLCSLIPQVTQLLIGDNDFNTVIEILVIMVLIEIVTIVKLFALWYNNEGMKHIAIQIWKDWQVSTESEMHVMKSNARKTKFISIFCISSSTASAMSYATQFFVTVYTDEIYVNATNLRPYFLQAYFPFGSHYSPMYEIICCWQVIAALVSCLVFSSFDGFFIFSILHFSGQLRILSKRMRNLVEEYHSEKSLFPKLLESVIRKHLFIIRNTDSIEHNFNKIFLTQIVVTSFLICLQWYQLATILTDNGPIDVGNLIFIICFVVGNMFSIFMLYFIAQKIHNESKRLLHSVYEMTWYELSPKYSRLLLILMNRLSLPIQITVGKFAPFSLEYFAILVKTCAGYFSVLIAVKNKLNEN